MDSYASGNWTVQAGQEQEFIIRWKAMLGWTAASVPGLISASLIHDAADEGHFVSFAAWDSAAAMEAWKSRPEFAELFGACRQLCDDFRGGGFVRVAQVTGSGVEVSEMAKVGS